MEQLRRNLAGQTRELLTRLTNRMPQEHALPGLQGTRCREFKPMLRQFLEDWENDFQRADFSDVMNLSDATHALTEWSILYGEADDILSLCTRRLASCPKEVEAVRAKLFPIMLCIAKMMTRAIVRMNTVK